MTSCGHVTSSGSCPIDGSWPLFYRLSIGTIPLSGFVFEIFSAKVPTTIITWWRHQWRHKARMTWPWGTYIQEHCVKISSNSDNNCRKRSILKKNHDVTIMTSSSHVTSSESCPVDRPWPLSYGLSFGTIPLSGFVSEIFSAKVATTIITWWRHQWRHKAHVNYPWGTYRHTTHRNIVLKYRPIPTRIAGEEAF